MRTTILLIFAILISMRAKGADATLTKAEGMLRAKKNVEEAKQLIAQYLTSKETADAYLQVGNLYARLRNWTDAVHYLEIASKRAERNALIWYELGLAQHQNKRTDDAVASLRHSLSISSTTEKTYTALGEILELSRDKYDARNIYLSALSKIGERPKFRKELCWLNFQDNFFLETIKQCTQAAHLDATDVNSMALLARTYYSNQQRPQAIKILQGAIDRFPKAAILYRVRGLIYFEEKAYEQAVNDLGKAFGLDPTDDEAAIHLARGYFELGYYDKALPIYVEACKIDRDYRFEFLSKQRELARKDRDDLSSDYQKEIDKF